MASQLIQFHNPEPRSVVVCDGKKRIDLGVGLVTGRFGIEAANERDFAYGEVARVNLRFEFVTGSGNSRAWVSEESVSKFWVKDETICEEYVPDFRPDFAFRSIFDWRRSFTVTFSSGSRHEGWIKGMPAFFEFMLADDYVVVACKALMLDRTHERPAYWLTFYHKIPYSSLLFHPNRNLSSSLAPALVGMNDLAPSPINVIEVLQRMHRP